MGEKRGQTVKVIYDFDTTKVCEIGVTKEDGIKWYRVTSKRFRSWDGPRQLTGPIQQPGHGVEAFANIPMETVPYEGPLYMYDSNIKVEKQGNEEYVETIEKPTNETVYVRRGNRL
jgi:hypothetical protein